MPANRGYVFSGYVTNIRAEVLTKNEIVTAYHQLFEVETSVARR